MQTFADFSKGLKASVSRPSLVALGWTYLVCLVCAGIFTLSVYSFVVSTVGSSALAEQLRQGATVDWMIDLAGTDGIGMSMATLMAIAVIVVPVFLTLVVFCSGGIVRAILRGLDGDRVLEPMPFLSVSGRYFGAMLRLALVEIVVIALAVGAVLVIRQAGLEFFTGPVFPWVWLVLSLFGLAVLTSIFDFARIGLVADDSRRSLSAFVGAIRFSMLNALPVLAIVVLNLVLSIAVAVGAIWVRSQIPLETGPTLMLGVLVGQISIALRLWTRIAAYGTEAAVWSRAMATSRSATPEPVPEPARAPEEEHESIGQMHRSTNESDGLPA